MTVIADVARLAGVSKSTVSRALTGNGHVSETTKLRVADAAVSLGYVPSTSAVSLATGRTRTIAVIAPKVLHWRVSSTIEGVEGCLIARGFDLSLRLVEPASFRRELLSTHLAQKRVDGVIAIGFGPSGGDQEQLLALNRPVVGIGGALAGIPTLGIDNFAAAAIATRHLVDFGHADIAFVGSTPPAHTPASDVDEKLSGYAQSMFDHGLESRIRSVPSNATLTDGYAAAASFLADPRYRPTGIVAACDEVGIGIIIAAGRMGIAVPAELSVAGIDGHDLSEMFALTTVQQHPYAQGANAAGLLLALVEDDDVPLRTVAETNLVVRASTGVSPTLPNVL